MAAAAGGQDRIKPILVYQDGFPLLQARRMKQAPSVDYTPHFAVQHQQQKQPPQNAGGCVGYGLYWPEAAEAAGASAAPNHLA